VTPAPNRGAAPLRLFDEPVPTPVLGDYDLVVVNSSAGKDSQASLDVTVEHARAAGVLDRVLVAHADLGRMEWPGTLELAAEHAAHYGLRFEVVRNRNWSDLLERIESRGRWPDAQNRYCTSEFKTGQVRRLFTQLTRELALDRPVRILNVLGLRGEESPARARKVPFGPEPSASTKTTRHVDRWLPIHAWTEPEVWERIEAAGTRPHPAYAAGMPRLSCSLCVLASRAALVRGAQLRPELAADYVAAEARMGHRFRMDLSMADIVAEASTGVVPVGIAGWAA
jgi:3'-phosphoadenosine 5'-phosphosulfate sulfotransferase (PAPS reductase)/FAD synthetase